MMQQNRQYIFQDMEGRILHTYDRDQPGRSTCYDECAKHWVPLTAGGDEGRVVGDWSVHVRNDGAHQWLYKGAPVYVPLDGSRSSPVADDKQWTILNP